MFWLKKENLSLNYHILLEAWALRWDSSFENPKHIKTDGKENINNCMLKLYAHLDLGY